MKSFLHRIAASVVRPQPSLHPFVESIYPATTKRQSNKPQFQFETETSTHSVQQVAETTHKSRVAGEEILPLNLPTTFPQNSASADREAYQALLPQSQTEYANIAAHLTKSKSDLAASASYPELPHLLAQQDLSSPTFEYAPIVVQPVPQANLPNAIYPTQPPTLREIQAALTRPSADRQSPQIPPAPRSTPQQSDDIQIHIGRIEVVAVPPPAARPAATPARKGLSLDEYLSRRNGRLG